MSLLLNGLIGVAIKIAPSLFSLLAADRDGGDVREQAYEIVKKLAETEDEEAANEKISKDAKLEAKIRVELAELELKALEDQRQAQIEQKKMDQAFLDLEKAEREMEHQQRLDLLDAEFASVESAREHALELSKSERWWVAGINPTLSLMITFGFILALYFILSTKEIIQNVEIFYTAIGTLATAFATIIAFHFGSSSGSKAKDEFIITESSEIAAASGSGAASVGSSPNTDPNVIGEQIPIAPPKATPKKPLPDPGGRFGLFRQKAPVIMIDLMSDFGLTLDQAGGVVGNAGHECAGFRTLQEIKPIVPGSRGGWGWFQWTGPRRRAFESWCVKNGFDNLSDDNANYGFLKHELETTEKNALGSLRKANSLRDATRSFMNKFERPGVKHFDSRMNWSREAIKAYRNSYN